MVEVILKSDYIAGGQRFRKNPNGGTTSIPQHIIDTHGLPKSAVVPDKSFKQPKPPEEDHTSVAEAAAKEEARVIEEAEAEKEKGERRRRRDKSEEEGGSVKDIVAKLPEMSEAELRKLLEDERAGKGRPSLIVEIEAAIEDLGNQGSQGE